MAFRFFFHLSNPFGPGPTLLREIPPIVKLLFCNVGKYSMCCLALVSPLLFNPTGSSVLQLAGTVKGSHGRDGETLKCV